MKPYKLSVRELWELYRILEKGIEDRQEYLIDEILDMLDKISKEDFLSSLWKLYPEIDFTKHPPAEMITLLIRGLKANKFFAFVDFVQGINRGNP